MDQAGNQEVLLEAGTNELEVLVFSLGPTRYGVNVAKVREIIAQVNVIHVPLTHPAVVGVFNMRDSVIPLVDLQLHFEPGVHSEAKQRAVILMEFNDFQLGFVVDAVERIYRIRWDEVRPMEMGAGNTSDVVTSVCELDERLVLMVDFEKIAFDLNGNQDVFEVSDHAGEAISNQRQDQRVLLAEDSPTIRAAIRSNLTRAGYEQLTVVGDGFEAWEVLESSLADDGGTSFTLVVTDIEMPRMDGLHLCKRIKDHPRFKHLPVVVFSSLVSDSNLKKCNSVGADAAITKPQMTKLVELLDQLLARKAGPKPPAEKELLLTAN